jgi:hypothetical protein
MGIYKSIVRGKALMECGERVATLHSATNFTPSLSDAKIAM